MEEQEEKKELHKGVECVKCKHLFDCKGKKTNPNAPCLNFEERVDIH